MASTSSALAEHKGEIVRLLSHTSYQVRRAALGVLGRLDQAVLSDLSHSIVTRLDDSDRGVKDTAEHVFKQLTDAQQEAALDYAQEASAIKARLADSDYEVRRAALAALGKLPAPTLANHAGEVVKHLSDRDADVRQAAVTLLAGLEASTLETHESCVHTLVNRLEGLHSKASDWNVTILQVIGKMRPGAWADSAAAIIIRLGDQNANVRRVALEALENLGPETLQKHAPLLARMTWDDKYKDVRPAAMRFLALLSPQINADVTTAFEEYRRLDLPNVNARRSALAALSKLHHDALGPPILECIERRCDDPDAQVRSAANSLVLDVRNGREQAADKSRRDQ